MFKLKVLSGATAFAVQSTARSRSHIDFGLHADNVRETNVNRIGLKKVLHEKDHETPGKNPIGVTNWHTLPKYVRKFAPQS